MGLIFRWFDCTPSMKLEPASELRSFLASFDQDSKRLTLAIEVPDPPPPPLDKPWTFQMDISHSFQGLTQHVRVRVRPYPSKEHHHHEGPSPTFDVPNPHDIDTFKWCRAMRWADYHLNLVQSGHFSVGDPMAMPFSDTLLNR